MKIDLSPPPILAECRRQGFSVIPGLVPAPLLDRIEAECDWFIHHSGSDFKRCVDEGQVVVTLSPRQMARTGTQDRMRAILEAFTQPPFSAICHQYLQNEVILDRIIVHYKSEGDQPATEWHADQQAEGLRSFKFMLYLNDIGSNNAGFSYAPGSHRMVQRLTREVERRGLPNQDVHHFTQMRRLAHELGLKDCIAYLDSLSRHIQGDFESDDAFSIRAPRGSVIFFDTRGLHRGGVVRNGVRKIVRLHCFETKRPSLRGKMHSWVYWKAHRDRPLLMENSRS